MQALLTRVSLNHEGFKQNTVLLMSIILQKTEKCQQPLTCIISTGSESARVFKLNSICSLST